MKEKRETTNNKGKLYAEEGVCKYSTDTKKFFNIVVCTARLPSSALSSKKLTILQYQVQDLSFLPSHLTSLSLMEIKPMVLTYKVTYVNEHMSAGILLSGTIGTY